jgi:hypothetical protein
MVQLGHNLMDHHFLLLQVVLSFEDKYTYGRRANGIYVPRYQNVGNDKREEDLVIKEVPVEVLA